MRLLGASRNSIVGLQTEAELANPAQQYVGIARIEFGQFDEGMRPRIEFIGAHKK